MKKLILFGAIALSLNSFGQVPNYVSSNGLLGWWPFNSNANDESLNTNDGAVNGATLIDDRFGNPNEAYSFDGNDEISILNFNSEPQFLSISLWFYTAVNGTGGTLELLHRCNPANRMDFAWNTSWGTDGGNNVIQSTLNNGVTTATSSISLNNWHHMVLTCDGAQKIIYVDGQIVSTDVLTGSINYVNKNGIFIGYDSEMDWFTGNIDDIGIWNRVLTSCEIQDLYNAQLNSTFVNAGTDQTICNGDPVTLSALNSQNYSWDNGVTDGVAFYPTATQDYTVSADSAGCLSTDVVTVTVNEHTTATQTETALDSYTWPINSQTYTSSGMYTAVIPNAAGCDSTITLDLSLDFTGLEENSQGALFSVFPNPAQSIINVKADNKLIGDVYTIYDNTGRVVLTGKLNAENTIIELGNLSGGIYMFSVEENMKQTFKVIKE